MSTPDPDPQQTAFLTSTSSGLATITSIYNGSSSALPAPTLQPPSATPPPSSSSPIVTGLTLGGKVGIAIGSAAVFAIFLWWFWPKRHRIKKKPDIPTSIAQDLKQSPVTSEVKKTDERHLSARVKTV